MEKMRATIVGRVLAVTKLKSVSFLRCRIGDSIVQCVLGRSIGNSPPAGSIVSFEGQWQPYGGRNKDFHQQELIVAALRVLAEAKTEDWRLWEQDERRRTFRLRGVSLQAAEEYFNRRDFLRIETPLVAGSEAAAGATKPFRICYSGEEAYLAVSNIVNQTRWQAAGFERVYQISRLFWCHHYRNRFSLNEFTLLEYSVAQLAVDGMIAYTTNLLEEIRFGLLRQWPSAITPPAPLTRTFVSLPVMDHSEIVRRAKRAGLPISDRGHILPSAVDGLICGQLGSHGYWCVNSPPETNPFYTRATTVGEKRVALNLELRLEGVSEVGSGSEWNRDLSEAELRVASWPNPAAGDSYLEIVRHGFPPATGFSLGIDRLMMFLLGVQRIADVVVEPRRQQTFASGRAMTVDSGMPIEPDSQQRVPNFVLMKRASKAVGAATAFLRSEGFLPAVTSLLGSEEEMSGTLKSMPIVDWYGKAALLLGIQERRHQVLITEGPDRLFEIGPTFPGAHNWWQPNWLLRVSWVTLDLEDVTSLATRVLQLLVDAWEDSEPEMRSAIANLRSGCEIQLPGVSPLRIELDDRSQRARWIWGPRVLADGQILPPYADAVPPIGSCAIHITQGLRLPWGVGVSGPSTDSL